MPDFFNRVAFSISNSPGTSGGFVVGAPLSITGDASYRALGASDNGKSGTFLIRDGGAWEIRGGCIYNHSTGLLSRGTLEESSTGEAINLTSSAVVSNTLSAASMPADFLVAQVFS